MAKEETVTKLYAALEDSAAIVKQLRARVAELEAALQHVKTERSMSGALDEACIVECEATIAAQAKQIKVAREALEFYVPMIRKGDSPAEEALAKLGDQP